MAYAVGIAAGRAAKVGRQGLRRRCWRKCRQGAPSDGAVGRPLGDAREGAGGTPGAMPLKRSQGKGPGGVCGRGPEERPGDGPGDAPAGRPAEMPGKGPRGCRGRCCGRCRETPAGVSRDGPGRHPGKTPGKGLGGGAPRDVRGHHGDCNGFAAGATGGPRRVAGVAPRVSIEFLRYVRWYTGGRGRTEGKPQAGVEAGRGWTGWPGSGPGPWRRVGPAVGRRWNRVASGVNREVRGCLRGALAGSRRRPAGLGGSHG